MKNWQNLTDMSDDLNIIDEMIKKYKNTILGIRHNNKTHYAKYDGYNSKTQMFGFTMKNGDNISVAKDTDTEIFIPNPEKGLYNTQQGAIFFCRNPLRQWKRGLCDANVILISINKRNLSNPWMFKTNTFAESWEDVLIESEYPGNIYLDNALEIANIVGSAAINRTYGVVLHPTNSTGYV
ncbi:MAG: hypothetical protein HGA25_07375, partial [Clostridiales bacterium]|nr:hypothetical protein [Clostridiales bacterium]